MTAKPETGRPSVAAAEEQGIAGGANGSVSDCTVGAGSEHVACVEGDEERKHYPEVLFRSDKGREWRYKGKRAYVLSLLASRREITRADLLPRYRTLLPTIRSLRRDGLHIETVCEDESDEAYYWLCTAGSLIQPTGPEAPLWEQAIGQGLLRAREVEYNGARSLDLRLWVDEGRIPTPQGIRMPPEVVSGLACALTAYAATKGSTGPENGV
jgi:hypothetical protein